MGRKILRVGLKEAGGLVSEVNETLESFALAGRGPSRRRGLSPLVVHDRFD
jgi:hypothetical protein